MGPLQSIPGLGGPLLPLGPVFKSEIDISLLGLQAHLAQGSNFNFQKFISRAFDKDFEQVVGIR